MEALRKLFRKFSGSVSLGLPDRFPVSFLHSIIRTCMHSYIKKMMTKSMNLLSICDTEEAMRRQHNEILRINAMSVKKSN